MGVQTGTTAILYDPAATTWAARKFAIYLRQVQRAELAQFVATTALRVRDPAQISSGVVERDIRSRVRKRYPGAPAISVSAGLRSLVVGPSIKIGTWPGRPITLERPRIGGDFDPADADVPMKVLQLTLDGSFSDFYLFCQSAKAIDFILRTNNGRPIYIGSPGP